MVRWWGYRKSLLMGLGNSIVTFWLLNWRHSHLAAIMTVGTPESKMASSEKVSQYLRITLKLQGYGLLITQIYILIFKENYLAYNLCYSYWFSNFITKKIMFIYGRRQISSITIRKIMEKYKCNFLQKGWSVFQM